MYGERQVYGRRVRIRSRIPGGVSYPQIQPPLQLPPIGTGAAAGSLPLFEEGSEGDDYWEDDDDAQEEERTLAGGEEEVAGSVQRAMRRLWGASTLLGFETFAPDLGCK